MKNYHTIMGVLMIICLLIISIIFFFDQQLSLVAVYALIVILILSWFINVIICSREIKALEDRVDKKIDNLDKKIDERIKPMEKTYGYLHFLDEANASIHNELQKMIKKYKELMKKREKS